MRRRDFCYLSTLAAGSMFFGWPGSGIAFAEGKSAKHSNKSEPRFVLDMVHFNPGEPAPNTAFLDPKRLADWGYGGQVVFSEVEGVPTFDTVSPDLLPKGSVERQWAEQRAASIDKQIQAAHKAGIKIYAFTQLIVFPKAVLAKYSSEICDAKGRIDIHLPKTQELLRAQMNEIFDRFPGLDGLIIRTGEVYLHDLPYHACNGNAKQSLTQGSTAIIHEQQSHIDILNVLRSEVCAKRNKKVFYRTWDFGNRFHINPEYYMAVTEAVEPHPNLLFSVKHQKGDFHQLTPFNPTLCIGKHRQIVEVQCQREGYGKGAHPYYVGQGVIEGWEEYAWIMKPGEPKGLRDIRNNPLFAGVWTWTRGGGWEGPYIPNELWCSLNAFVISKFAENPERTEADIFAEFTRRLGLKPSDAAKFRELSLLSTKAVVRGQLSLLPAKINVWWPRDHFMAEPDLSDFIRKGLVTKALEEKAEAVKMWKNIEELSREIQFKDKATKDFVVTSATYGRLKFSIIEQAWTVLFYGKMGDASGTYDKQRIATALAEYDRLWDEWRKLKENNPACSTIYKDIAFGERPGIGAAMDRYRKVV